MIEVIPPCHMWPMVLMFAGCAGAAFIIMRWARDDPKPEPAWRWGDAPRRRKRAPDGIIGHCIGMMLAGLAVAYALNFPICG